MELARFIDLVRSSLALRLRLPLQPAGGDGTKVAPPTYSGPLYATESRVAEGKVIPCVLLDSTAAQANRMERALLGAWHRREINIPIVYSDFTPYCAPDVDEKLRLSRPVGWVTSLDAPHRISDAILRDSIVVDEGLIFRTPRVEYESSWGRRLRQAGFRQARVLYEICPTALILGMWDATMGTFGLRIERAITNEIVGLDVVFGTRTSSRIDPLGVERDVLTIYRAEPSHPLPWTVVPERAQKIDGKPLVYGKEGTPSEINHGNVLPVAERGGEKSGVGGVTMRAALLTSVVSLAALRRFSFPDDTTGPASEVDLIGQSVLAALAVAGVSLMLREGLDLRSRCVLCPSEEIRWEALSPYGGITALPDLRPETAVKLLAEAVAAAEAEGLVWLKEPLRLEPTDDLIRLLAAGQRPSGGSLKTEESKQKGKNPKARGKKEANGK